MQQRLPFHASLVSYSTVKRHDTYRTCWGYRSLLIRTTLWLIEPSNSYCQQKVPTIHRDRALDHY